MAQGRNAWTLAAGVHVLEKAEGKIGVVLSHHQKLAALHNRWPHLSPMHVKQTIKKYDSELPDGVADTGTLSDWLEENWVLLGIGTAAIVLASKAL